MPARPSSTLDLKSDTGRAQMTALLARADILLELYRPGVLDRLGFGTDALQAINPRLIHCALSGYGQTGPLRQASGHDINYEAMTGGLDQCYVDRPVIPFPPMADYAGSLQSVLTILGALHARSRTGKGCTIDIGMAEALLFWNTLSFSAPMPRGAGLLNGGAAFYQIYPTADGRFVTLSPLEPKFWDNFCVAVERLRLAAAALRAAAAAGADRRGLALFASKPLAHWDALLPAADCCYHAVLTLSEVPDHPQVAARGLIDRSGRWTDVLFPARIDGTPPLPRQPLVEIPVEEVLARWTTS